MLDTVIKGIELAARYSWAFSVAIAFVLFVPNEAAAQIGVLPIRQEYLGFLWVGLVGCSALFVSAVAPEAKGLLKAVLYKRSEERKTLESHKNREDKILLRLRSLGPQELLWLKYCLYHGQQTVFGEASSALAHALIKKGLVAGGSGTVWKVSYSFLDEVWKIANEYGEEFMPASERQDPSIEQDLKVLDAILLPRIF